LNGETELGNQGGAKEALAESEHELMDELLTEPADTAPEQDEA
jgi:hypothetical protein